LGASRRIHPAGLRSAADPSHPQNTNTKGETILLCSSLSLAHTVVPPDRYGSVFAVVVGASFLLLRFHALVSERHYQVPDNATIKQLRIKPGWQQTGGH
jgi:hypothetical protein